MSKVAENLALCSTVMAMEEHVSSNLAGEAVILDLKSGIYYGLDVVGSRIWYLIQVPRTIAEIRDLLLDEFDVEPLNCEHDLLAILRELEENGLITIKNAAFAPTPASQLY
jgi:hypothetical protein